MSVNYGQAFEPKLYYHIYNRSNNKEALFLREENYYYFLRQWNKYLSPYLKTFAYALIPNHFHFVVKVHKNDSTLTKQIQQEQTTKSRKYLENEITLDEFLEDQMKRFLISYAKAFNKENGRTGSLFQKRFKRITILDNEHLKHLIAYLHHNPIHHALVTDFGIWKYTSYQAVLSEKPTKIPRIDVLNLFNDEQHLISKVSKTLEVYRAKTEFLKYHKNFKADKKTEHLLLDFEKQFIN